MNDKLICKNFCNAHCSLDCPNAYLERACDRFDLDPSDFGLERIACDDCQYSDDNCSCDDCYFMNNPEYCFKVQK